MKKGYSKQNTVLSSDPSQTFLQIYMILRPYNDGTVPERLLNLSRFRALL